MNFLEGLKKLLGGAVKGAGQMVPGVAQGVDFAKMVQNNRQAQQPMPQQQVGETQRRAMLNDAIGMPYGDYTARPPMPQGRQGAPFIPRPQEDDAMVWGPRGAQPLNTIQRNQPWQRMNNQQFDPYDYY